MDISYIFDYDGITKEENKRMNNEKDAERLFCYYQVFDKINNNLWLTGMDFIHLPFVYKVRNIIKYAKNTFPMYREMYSIRSRGRGAMRSVKQAVNSVYGVVQKAIISGSSSNCYVAGTKRDAPYKAIDENGIVVDVFHKYDPAADEHTFYLDEEEDRHIRRRYYTMKGYDYDYGNQEEIMREVMLQMHLRNIQFK